MAEFIAGAVITLISVVIGFAMATGRKNNEAVPWTTTYIDTSKWADTNKKEDVDG